MSDLPQNLLIDAYTNALYEIDTDPPIQFCISVKSAQLANLLARHNANSAAFITAHNPKSQKLTQAANSSRHEKLIEQLKQGKKQFVLGRSKDPSSQWPTEISILVFELSPDQAITLGREYGQNAIVFIENDLPNLIWIEPVRSSLQEKRLPQTKLV